MNDVHNETSRPSHPLRSRRRAAWAALDHSDFRNSAHWGDGRIGGGVGAAWPNTRRTILVLTSLSGGDMHGYAVIKDIEAMTGVTFGPGTLCAVLARLEAEGLVEALSVAGGFSLMSPVRIRVCGFSKPQS